MTPRLFSPLRLREVTLRNRIVLSPMLTYEAHNGFPSDWHLVHLGKYATGGVGLVFMESTKVDPRGCSTPNDLGLWKDAFIDPLRRISGYIKSQGAAAGIQIAHSGRKARTSAPWEGRRPLCDKWPGVDRGEPWELIGPSAIAHGPGYSVPRPMTIADIEEQIEVWGRAAERADKAGFDVLELHGAHGYLIHQFLSAKSNQRTDKYGGSLENRMRLALQIAARVRQSWPQEKPLFFRASAVDHEGWTLQETIRLSIELSRCGVDVIDCSSGGMSPGRTSLDTAAAPSPGYQVAYAEAVRRQAAMSTMAVGLILDGAQAEAILSNGQADLVALGRELLRNPHWALDAAVSLGCPEAYSVVPDAYGYWLAKRAAALSAP